MLDFTFKRTSCSVLAKFLKDSEVSSEIKDICYKLSENPYVDRLIENTPISSIFEACEEYKKHMSLYDDVLNGKIRIFIKEVLESALPIYSFMKVPKDSNLKILFGPNTLAGGIVEKFIICDAASNKIKRIAIETKNNKLLTVGYDSKNKVKTMLIEYPEVGIYDPLTTFLHITHNKRLDLIRT